MSTFREQVLTCPTCSAQFEVHVLEGLHITRLPEVRAAILAGTFHMFPCPGCSVPALVETRAIYTDFDRHHYVAVEFDGDWREVRDVHRRMFDQSFTLGPPAAQELGLLLRTRLVFGYPALREKLLLWDAGYDDHLFEALKGEWRRYTGDPARLRVQAVLEGGHLLCSRSMNGTVVGHRTFPASEFAMLYQNRDEVASAYPELGRDWFVDLATTTE